MQDLRLEAKNLHTLRSLAIFTVGHLTRTPEEFVALLWAHGI